MKPGATNHSSGLLILVTTEKVAGIDFFFDIIQTGIVTVCNNCLADFLELAQVNDNPAPEEGAAIFQGGFVDDDGGSFGFDALHDTLNGGLTEVIGICFHGQSVNSDDAFFFVFGGIVTTAGIIVVSSHGKNSIGNKVFSGSVGFHNGGHHVLGNIRIVGQQLLGVLGQTVAAVAK